MVDLIATLRSAARRVVQRRPTHPFVNLAAKARAVGIDGVLIVLSFDCDTALDAVAARALDEQLVRRGIARTYAVPGRTLSDAACTYRALAAQGAIFINHGARPHAQERDGRFEAITFYNEMTSEQVVDDMREGHRIVCDVIGAQPRGFRAPHFGYFQKAEQRALVYDTARSLGYLFCSDTLPGTAFAHGPVFDVGGLHEFPLTGSLADPNVILDSWNYLADRVDYRLLPEFLARFTSTVDFFADRKLSVLLNFYVDPSHIANDGYFLQAIDHALGRGARFLGFEQVLARAGAHT